MIPIFTLASDPQKKVQFREANVADAMDFVEVDEGHDEEVTTLFLNRVQQSENYTDSLTWTADDRRLALFWYWVNTSPDPAIPVTYECDHCGERHTYLLNMNDLIEGYKSIQGRAEREFEFEGEKIIVRPLKGSDMELLELKRLALADIEEMKGTSSGAYRRKLAEIRLLQFLCSVCDAKQQDKLEAIENKVLQMPERKFVSLVDQVAEKLEEMEHGLKSEYVDGQIFLLAPPHKCPNQKGKEELKTLLRVPFRIKDFIPTL